MTVKEQVLAKLKTLPDSATLADIREEIEIIEAIEEGQRDAAAGRVHTADELKGELRSWVVR